MAWLCLKDDSLQNTIMVVVTGPRQDMTNDLITRFKRLFIDYFEFPDAKDRAVLNRVDIRAYPSNHTETIRSIPNVSLVLMDEADFFEKSEQKEVIDATERYIGKSDPYLIMISTPNDPEGLFNRIEVLPEEECIYRRFHIDYRIGLPNKIDPDNVYTFDEIEKAKASWSFDREYDLKYLGHVGNIFNMNDITDAFTDKYNPEENLSNYTIERSMGVDPGFGTSLFAVVVTQLVNGKAEVIFSDTIERGDTEQCITLVQRLTQQWHIDRCYVDGSAVQFIRDLKKSYQGNDKGTAYNWHLLEPEDLDAWITATSGPYVIPVHFQRHGENMLRHLETLLQKKLIRIDKRFDRIEIALRTATSKGEKYQLDKDKSSHDDVLDALRLSLLNFHL